MHFGIEHVLHQYGYFGVLFIFISEMIGAPFPAETTLTVCGVAWAQGVFTFTPLWGMAALGNILGSTITYAIGYYFGYPVIQKYGRFIGITETRFQKIEVKFVKLKKTIVFFGKFISGIRVLTPYIAGINRMNFIEFSLWNSASAMLWSAFFILEGRYFALLWHRYHFLFQRYEVLFILILAGILLTVWIRFNVRRKGHREGKTRIFDLFLRK